MHFDATSEEWESLIPEHQRPFLDYCQAIQVDQENVLITGGKNTAQTRTAIVDDEEGSVFCEIYNMKLKKFFLIPNLQTGRYQHCMALLQKNAYVIGGIFDEKLKNGQGYTSSVEKINIAPYREKIKKISSKEEPLPTNNRIEVPTVTWIEIEPFVKYRNNANCFIFKEEIYLIGGMQSNGKICRYVERYNPTTNQWTLLKWKMPIAIHSFSITPFNNNEILLVGGKNDAGITPSIYQLDFENRKYQSRGAFSFRVSPKIIQHHEDIYIFGGDNEKSCEKLNPEKFVSYAASESYTTFLDDDLTRFSASHTCVNLNGQANPSKSSQNQSDPFATLEQKLNNSLDDLRSYFLFGTPNHPFVLELNHSNETVVPHSVGLEFRFYYFGFSLRISDEFILSMGGITPPKKNSSRSVQLFSTKAMTSKRLAKMKTGRCKFTALLHKNLVYILGGLGFQEGKEVQLSSMEVYDFKKNEWTALAPMNSPRYNCGICQHADKIYAFGGSDGGKYLSSIEAYIISENKWTLFPAAEFSLKNEISYLNVLPINADEFLMVGGATVDDSLSDINLINLKEKTIVKKGDLSVARQGVKYIRNKECIIVLGGSKTGSGVECIKTNNWGVLKDKFLNFDEFIGKFYRDRQLNGIQGA